jgi:hypothetical protein
MPCTACNNDKADRDICQPCHDRLLKAITLIHSLCSDQYHNAIETIEKIQAIAQEAIVKATIQESPQ